MSHPSVLNIGAYVAPLNAGVLATITAGAGQNGLQQTGPTIDRITGGPYDSANFAMLYNATLTVAKTLIGAATVQHSADGSTWVNAPAEAQPGGVAGGGTIGTASATGANVGVFEWNALLRGCNQFIRVLYTGTLSNTATDTATLGVVCTLGGAQQLPI